MAKPDRSNDEVRVCVMPHAYTRPDGHVEVIPAGGRLRASHPAVALNGAWFVPADSADNERPSWRLWVGAGHKTEQPPRLPDGHRGPRPSGLVTGA